MYQELIHILENAAGLIIGLSIWTYLCDKYEEE